MSRRVIPFVVACLVAASCGGGSDGSSVSAPTSPTPSPTPDGRFFVSWCAVSPPTTIQFQGHTYAGGGTLNFNLAPGTYDITGTLPDIGADNSGFHNGGVTVGFGRSGGSGSGREGGVQFGSVQNLSPVTSTGPFPNVTSCGISYDTGYAPQNFHLRFTVTTSAAVPACVTPELANRCF